MRQQIRPLFDRIVVKEVEPNQMRQSGLLVPRQDTRPPQEGIVVAAGEGIDWWQGAGVEMPVKVGDHVLFHYSSGTYVTVDEEELVIMHVAQVLGVLEEVADNPLEEVARRMRERPEGL